MTTSLLTPVPPSRSTGFAAVAFAAMLMLAGCGGREAPPVNTEPPVVITSSTMTT